jgi:hypothetical protein
MKHLRMRVITILALLCLGLVNASPIAAQSDRNGDYGNNDNGNRNENGNDNNGDRWDKKDPPTVSATPELDSLVLFGTGAAGVAGYALMRLRAGRRQDENQETPATPS